MLSLPAKCKWLIVIFNLYLSVFCGFNKCKTIKWGHLKACLVLKWCMAHWGFVHTWHVTNLEKPVQSMLSSVNALSLHENMAKGFLRTSDQQVDKYLFTFSYANTIKIGLEHTPNFGVRRFLKDHTEDWKFNIILYFWSNKCSLRKHNIICIKSKHLTSIVYVYIAIVFRFIQYLLRNIYTLYYK